MLSDNVQRTALVVDYDLWERTFTTDVLVREGYLVLGASNGASGLRLAEQHPCDVILLDLSLPELQGVEFLQRLKAMDSTRDIPVIVLGAMPIDQTLFTEGCVPKPLEEVRVMSEVGRCVHSEGPPCVEP
jgi:CheY-like chemotaxis protein